MTLRVLKGIAALSFAAILSIPVAGSALAYSNNVTYLAFCANPLTNEVNVEGDTITVTYYTGQGGWVKATFVCGHDGKWHST
jgi:hypothetical protein